jgi:protein arginine kinase activator
MLCKNCRKNQATKTCEQITDGIKQTEYYCADCYYRLFISVDDLNPAPSQGEKKPLVCSCCGTTEEDFRATGLVGCSQCYQTLASVVTPVIIRLQGRDTHEGSQPSKTDVQEETIYQRNFMKDKCEQFLKDQNYAAAEEASKKVNEYNRKIYKK